MGVPKKGWFIMENPFRLDDDWGYLHDLGNLWVSIPNISLDGMFEYMGVSINGGDTQNGLEGNIPLR